MLYGFLSFLFCTTIGATLLAWFEAERAYTWAPGPFLPVARARR